MHVFVLRPVKNVHIINHYCWALFFFGIV